MRHRDSDTKHNEKLVAVYPIILRMKAPPESCIQLRRQHSGTHKRSRCHHGSGFESFA